MKTEFLKAKTNPDASFMVRKDRSTGSLLHGHTEMELICFNAGSGSLFIGENILEFDEGDVILLGPNLPHGWKFRTQPSYEGEVLTIRFRKGFWGDVFLNLPENTVIRAMLEKSGKGIRMKKREGGGISKLMEAVMGAEGPQRIILFMEILAKMAMASYVSLIEEEYYNADHTPEEDKRMERITAYIRANFRNKISLKEIAGVASMNENSFCRYFKSKTRKTFIQFLNEVRIKHACRLLMESKMSIKQIYYESGFSNITCFYKYFKGITGKSPLHYQQQFAV